jgi:hypothetical protein
MDNAKDKLPLALALQWQGDKNVGALPLPLLVAWDTPLTSDASLLYTVAFSGRNNQLKAWQHGAKAPTAKSSRVAPACPTTLAKTTSILKFQSGRPNLKQLCQCQC